MRLLWIFLSGRYWREHLSAAVLCVLGVALGIAVFVSVQIANHSVLRAFRTTLEAVAGRANLQIVGSSDGLDERVFPQVAHTPGVLAAAPRLEEYALWDREPTETLLVLGVDLLREPEFRAYDFTAEGLTTEAALKLLLDPHTLALSTSFAAEYHLQVGDTLHLQTGTRTLPFEICALFHTAPLSQAMSGRVAVMDIATAQEAFGRLGRLDSIDLIVPEEEVEAVARRLRAFLPPETTVQRPRRRSEQVAKMLGAFRLNLTALSCLAIFVGMFLVYNSVAIAVLRRRRAIGIVRSLGVQRRLVLALFLLEAGLFGFGGSLLGLGLGILLARYTLAAVARTVSALYLTVVAEELVLPPGRLIGAMALGVLTALVAGWLPAWEAATVPPREALQMGTVHQRVRLRLRHFVGWGGTLLLLAGMLCLPPVTARWKYSGFAAALLILSSFAFLTPPATVVLQRLLQPLLGLLGGVEGRLAGRNLVAALRRTTVVIAALMVSLAMLLGLAVMIRSFRYTVDLWIRQTALADLYLSPGTGFAAGTGRHLPGEVVEAVRALPEVKYADTLRGVRFEWEGQPVFLAAVEVGDLAHTDRFLFRHGNRAEIARRFAEGELIVSESFARKHRAWEGQYVALPTPAGKRKFRLAAVCYDYSSDAGIVYLHRQVFTRLWQDEHVDGLALRLRADASPEEVAAKIRRLFAGRHELLITSNRELRAEVLRIFDQTFAITYALQFIALVVAVLGIVDTLLALILERGRDLGLLRALGASPAQIRRITLWEAGLIGGLSYLIGLGCGILLAAVLILVINRQFFGWTILFTWPGEVFVRSFLLVILAALGAGLFPAHLAARRPPAEALRME